MVMLGSLVRLMARVVPSATVPVRRKSAAGKDLIFSQRPQNFSPEEYRMWDALVTDMRRESQALPMNTMMLLLIERVATMYVMVRTQEAGSKKADWDQLRSMQKLFLNFVTEFSTQLHKNSQTPEQRFMSSFKAALNTAIRKAGPDATVRELMPILVAELQEFNV